MMVMSQGKSRQCDRLATVVNVLRAADMLVYEMCGSRDLTGCGVYI